MKERPKYKIGDEVIVRNLCDDEEDGVDVLDRDGLEFRHAGCSGKVTEVFEDYEDGHSYTVEFPPMDSFYDEVQLRD